MPIYLVTLEAWQSRPNLDGANAPGTHTATFAVRAHSAGAARRYCLSRPVAYLPGVNYCSISGEAVGWGWVGLDEIHIVKVRISLARARMGVWGELSLCTDCMLTSANGECGERAAGEPEPLSLLRGEHVVLGATEHLDDCTPVDREEGCDCAEFGYCTYPCDGCGSTLHGDRHAGAVLRERAGKHWIHDA